jgi:hypothetical protein
MKLNEGKVDSDPQALEVSLGLKWTLPSENAKIT